ncbi:type VII secretion system-associated protein [Streptomyces sp. NPDC047072]|uniref:type VII secretion system-associated protein n=1 Tax=Streptomyces sp. NPDC047072 TaxID=3154809 RepID=UPI0033CB3763
MTSEQHRPQEHSEERPFSRLAEDLQVRLTGGPDDYKHKAEGPVQYVLLANMEGILGALFASDAEGAVDMITRPELDPDASNSGVFWLKLRRSAKQRGLAPTEALAEMARQEGGYPLPGRVLPGSWQEAPNYAALRREIVGDGKKDPSPRDLKIHVYPVFPFRARYFSEPEVTGEMRVSARRRPGRVIYAIDPAYNPHGEVPDHAKLGGWVIDENGEIEDGLRYNPDYRPSLAALRWRAPENEPERALQALWLRQVDHDVFLNALRAATLLVAVEADGTQLRFRARDDGDRDLDVYTSSHYLPDGTHVRPMNGGELAKGLHGCYLAVNTGSDPGIRFPASELALSAFG